MWPIKKKEKDEIKLACKHHIAPDQKCVKCLEEAFPEIEEFTMRELLERTHAELDHYSTRLWSLYNKINKAKHVMLLVESDDELLCEMGFNGDGESE